MSFYPLSSFQCKEYDDFLSRLSRKDLIHKSTLSDADLIILDYIEANKSMLLFCNQDYFRITKEGKEFLSKGGFKKEENEHSLKFQNRPELKERSKEEIRREFRESPTGMLTTMIFIGYVIYKLIKFLTRL